MCLGMGMVVEPTTSARELEGSNWMDPEKEQVRAEEKSELQSVSWLRWLSLLRDTSKETTPIFSLTSNFNQTLTTFKLYQEDSISSMIMT
jgi:hypothetical protein